MQNGICSKCGTKSVYFSNAGGAQNGLKTGDGSPLLNIYKDEKWFPSITLLNTNYYVCQNCGYFEIYIRDISELSKLDDCTNWQKVE